ncbi:glycoside hydrolase family 13 protein [Leifsonia sp. H3M29-4]|uniref:glycoside hydrolase family 13 protein n=1 Tax=Salinibacterium metalliresistens TaxID=3031321 RepID=UPI0023DC62E7|nr:glycoside hydrolase family 13 protein [Salinibacterium metalliresistens]MDF1478702.1 glycoside hydrolase family 13 protein [Salinibacterium metalliresistens]
MSTQWWHDAVVYQIYLRSFADANGDGVGDLAGLISRLDYLQDLGVDALWLNPCYRSPQRDHGYDIADYYAIDEAYGSVADLERLVTEAHSRGMRLLLDMVANHCSDQHAWFQEALVADAGSRARERFLFRDGRGESGELPPNNWQSVFGGPAWTRVADGQWYFHAFDSSQPDFNWRNQEVVEYFDGVLRFWFERGVDGFRIDVAHGLFKAADMPDAVGDGHNYGMWDQPEVHDIYRRWRAIGDENEPEKYFVGEIWVPSLESMTAYLVPDELHQAFTFDLLVQPWESSRMTAAIERALGQAAAVGGPPAWTLSNHDVHRTATRYGQEQHLDAPLPTDMIAAARRQGTADLDLGVRRAKAAIMLQLALPGAAYLYQGEELGLPEVFDLPDDARQDPIWLRSGGAELGRDGCRVPMPWDATAPTFGFSPSDATAAPWLPQPAEFGDYAANSQAASEASTLALYRKAISARRAVFGEEKSVQWLESGHPELLALRRGAGICVVNFGDHDLTVPGEWRAELVLGSESFGSGTIVPANSAAWLSVVRVPLGSAARSADRARTGSPAPQLESTAP